MDFNIYKYANYIYIIVIVFAIIYTTYRYSKDIFTNEYIKDNYINERKRIEKMNGFKNRFSIPFSKHYNVFKVFKEFVELCDDNNIKYNLCGGLLIGLFRHNNSFVPWDDDIDVCMTKENFNKLKEVLKQDQYLYITDFIIKFSKEKEFISDDYPFIDIFLIEKKDDIYQYSYEIHRKNWPKEYFMLNEIDNLEEKEFHLYLPDGNIYDTINVKIPSNSKGFLDRAYKNWDHKYLFNQSHSNFYKYFNHFEETI